MMWAGNLAAQLLGLAGFGLLAVPAFHAARYGKLLIIADAARPVEGAAGAEAFQAAVDGLKKHHDNWKPWKGWCLKGGAILTILSYGLAAYVAYYSPE
jgi:hypothetical protein